MFQFLIFRFLPLRILYKLQWLIKKQMLVHFLYSSTCFLETVNEKEGKKGLWGFFTPVNVSRAGWGLARQTQPFQFGPLFDLEPLWRPCFFDEACRYGLAPANSSWQLILSSGHIPGPQRAFSHTAVYAVNWLGLSVRGQEWGCEPQSLTVLREKKQEMSWVACWSLDLDPLTAVLRLKWVFPSKQTFIAKTSVKKSIIWNALCSILSVTFVYKHLINICTGDYKESALKICVNSILKVLWSVLSNHFQNYWESHVTTLHLYIQYIYIICIMYNKIQISHVLKMTEIYKDKYFWHMVATYDTISKIII